MMLTSTSSANTCFRNDKCDESQPTCGNCRRHHEPCLYSNDRTKLKPDDRRLDQARSDLRVHDVSPGVSSINTTFRGPLESRSRRLLELELLHHWNTRTSQTISVSGDATGADAWILKAPNLAFSNDALLNAILSLSACHMAEIDLHHGEEIMDTHRRYLDLALCQHSEDVTNLSEYNFDAVCITSSIIRIIAFVKLRDRCLDPYTPPVLWMQMTRGAVDVFEAAWKWVEKDEDSTTFRLTKRMPFVFDEAAKFAVSNRQGLLSLLQRDEEDVEKERWHADDQEAYETTISYIGGVRIALKGPETSGEICRRLILFPYLIRRRFIDLVKDQQPRALAVLAHYFALLASFRDVWWIGVTGRREVQALATVLSGKWYNLMSWPLSVTEE